MFVSYHRDGNVGVVTLDRPDRKNSIGQDILEDLERAWAAFMADEEWAEIKRRTAAEHGSLVDIAVVDGLSALQHAAVREWQRSVPGLHLGCRVQPVEK